MIDAGSLVRCSYCRTTRRAGRHNGTGGHLFITLAAMLGLHSADARAAFLSRRAVAA